MIRALLGVVCWNGVSYVHDHDLNGIVLQIVPYLRVKMYKNN